jgi:hypothetical protein
MFISWFWHAFWWRNSNIYLDFSTFISKPASLLASFNISVSFTVSMLPPWMDRHRKNCRGQSQLLQRSNWEDTPQLSLYTTYRVILNELKAVEKPSTPGGRLKYKRKAIPVSGRGGLYRSEMLSIPHCLDNRLTDNCEILATCSSTYSPIRTSQEAHSISIK